LNKILAETDAIRFLVGTQSLRYDNQVTCLVKYQFFSYFFAYLFFSPPKTLLNNFESSSLTDISKKKVTAKNNI
jgi:hypothetical protein